MEKIKINRVFRFKKNNKDITLTDPDENMLPAKVAVFYSNQYPELLNASVTGPKYEDDKAVYTFGTSVGVKG